MQNGGWWEKGARGTTRESRTNGREHNKWVRKEIGRKERGRNRHDMSDKRH